MPFCRDHAGGGVRGTDHCLKLKGILDACEGKEVSRRVTSVEVPSATQAVIS